MVGSVAAVVLGAAGLGGIVGLFQGGFACCSGGGEAAAEGGVEPTAIAEAAVSVGEFLKEHCCCCCEKEENGDKEDDKKAIGVKMKEIDDTESADNTSLEEASTNV